MIKIKVLLRGMPKLAAIVSAYNEERTIRGVLEALQEAKIFKDIVLVVDGGFDKTAEIGRRVGVKVVEIFKNLGKGRALRMGVKSTDAEILFFTDADLIGLNPSHILKVLQPVLEGKAVMSTGIIGSEWISGIISNLVRYFFNWSGTRAVRREIFEKLTDNEINGYGVESALNYYCFLKKLPIVEMIFKDIIHLIKEKKRGVVRGFLRRLKMYGDIIRVTLNFIFKII